MNESLSKKISIYNFICTLGIVIYHWKNFYILFSNKENYLSDSLYNFYDLLASISLGFFFMTSAYLFYLGIDSGVKLVKKIKKRLITLGIPFIVWNILCFAYSSTYSLIRGRGLDVSLGDIILGFTLDPFDGPFWYIVALIVLMSISPLLLKLKKKPQLFLIVVITLTIVCSIVHSEISSENMFVSWLLRLLNYTPIYIFGAYLALCKSRIFSRGRYINKVISVLALLSGATIVLYFTLVDVEANAFTWCLKAVLPILLWLAVPDELFGKAKIVFPIRISFFLYAMHGTLIGILDTIFTKLVGYNNMPLILSIICHIVLFTILYLVCLAFAFITKKILPKKIYFALSGGRV